MAESETINSLWIGGCLSAMELLTLKSFVANGHSFTLWTYEEIITPIPEGVVVKDANDILEKHHLFSYEHSNQYGHGKGSVAGFSDTFRYKLLHDRGGWWVDMDVTCLRPFTFDQHYFFRAHHDLPVVGNVMKCPAKSPVMKFCFEESVKRVGKENRDWNLPIRILNEGVERFQLQQYVHSDLSPPDQWHIVSKFLFTKASIPDEFMFIHWLNEVWRSKQLDKGLAWEKSAYGLLLKSLEISFEKAPLLYERVAYKTFNFLFSVRAAFSLCVVDEYLF